MSQITYVGQVLKDGHLSVAPEVKQALRLQPGDQLRVTLARDGAGPEMAELESLVSRSREELNKIADYQFPRPLQRRMERLLAKNRNSTLTAAEQAELERVTHDSLIERVRKAQARYLLSRRAK